MENKKTALLTITCSFALLFALITTSVDILAFAPIQSSPIPSQAQPPQQLQGLPPSPPLPSQQSSSSAEAASPSQAQPPQQLQGLPPQTTPSSAGIETNGTINSIINISPSLSWLAKGNYSLVDDGIHAYFLSLQKWTPTVVENDTFKGHKHELMNFRPIGPIVKLPNKDMQIKGYLDIGTNNNKWWKNVLTLIEIKGNTIAINPIGSDTDSIHARAHFAFQKITGIADSVPTPCSGTGGPGPNMEVLSECSFPSSLVETSTSTPSTQISSSTNNGMLPFFPLPP
jgi:hypothetical protein